MEAYSVFKDLAIIVIAAKACGILARKLKAPQVVGEIVAGLLIGPSLLGWVQQTDFLMVMAEVGVVLLMFSAGLETNLKELMKTGPIALVIACAGVFIPLGAGTLFLYGHVRCCTVGERGISESSVRRDDHDSDVCQYHGPDSAGDGASEGTCRDNHTECGYHR